MNKYLLIFALIFAVVSHSNLSKAQTCTACFTATAESINSLVINLDASCSNAFGAFEQLASRLMRVVRMRRMHCMNGT